MKQLRRIAGSVFVAVFLCSCVAPNSQTHRDKASRAMTRACTLLMGGYDKGRHERAQRELEIARRELKLAREAATKESEIAKRDMDEFYRVLEQTSEASRRKLR